MWSDAHADALHKKLSSSLAAIHDVLLRSTGQVANKSVHDFVADMSFLGPVLVACSLTDGKGGMRALPELSYGGWPADGGAVAVALRSLSKMVTAATYLMLVERGEGGLALDSRLGVVIPECAGSRLASTTAMDAMSMRAPLDNRLNAAWGVSQGMADHASFPPECDGLGLGALECVALASPTLTLSPSLSPKLSPSLRLPRRPGVRGAPRVPPLRRGGSRGDPRRALPPPS